MVIRGTEIRGKDLEIAMNRTYELMFIVRPDMADEDLDKLIANLESTVTSAAGSIKSVDRMGKRRLAYVVRKFREGVYILMTIEGAGTVVHELERRLRVTEPVIKFLTVRIDLRAEAPGQDQEAARREKEGERAARGRGGRSCCAAGGGDSSDGLRKQGLGIMG